MKKKYIVPAVEIEQLNVADGILQSVSLEVKDTSANQELEMETKGSGNWSDIWE